MANPIRRPFKYCFFSASLILIVVNLIIYFITNSSIKLMNTYGLNPGLFLYHRMYWQIFTYMFLHGNFNHLISNMLGLFFFGFSVEKALGSKEFLLIYFLCGILSGLFSLGYFIATDNYRTLLIGASGALYSIMLAYAVIYPKANIYIFGLIPIPAPILVIIYAIIEFFTQFTGLQAGIAHFAHLFGFLTAFLYFIIRMGVNPLKVWKNAYFN